MKGGEGAEKGEFTLDSLDEAPGGSWNDLHPTESRQIRASFQKQFLIKLRHPASIIEFIVAFIIVALIYLVYALAYSTTKEIVNPPSVYVNGTFPMLYVMTMPSEANPPKFILWPKNANTEYLTKTDSINIGGTPVMSMNILAMYAKLNKLEPRYVETYKEMEDLVYETDGNAVAIHWINSAEPDAFINPQIEMYYQSLMGNPERDVFHSIRAALAFKQFKEKYTADPTDAMIPNLTALSFLNFSFTSYATPSNTVYFDIGMAVAIFGVLPIIFSTMPDFQTLFEEKDSRILGLSLLMGCSETTYWFVSFMTPFILSFFPYLLMGLLLCFAFGMVGTNFGLYLIIMILFIFSEISFQFWITTFMKKGSSGRAMTVVLLVFMFFFAMLHSFFTLDPDQSSDAIKHVFSIVPFSALQLFLMSGYKRCNQGLPPYTFNTKGEDVLYAPWICLLWLFIDSILFFTLFLLFNATNPRNFGTPPLAWKEFFTKSAWKRAFTSRKKAQEARIAPITDTFMEVHGLKKVFHSRKDVEALRGVDFSINSGEVIVVIGPNGAGKSTLCNILAGATEPSDGYLSLLGGTDTKRFVEVQRFLGICLQENILINLLSVREHFTLFGAFRGVPEEQLAKSVDFFCHQLQLGEMLDNRAGDLSGGQKRKLCIALSLLGDPPLIIMDEPTAGVDVQARQLIWKMISNLKGTTTIVTSHALEEAEAVSSRLFIMNNGKIEFSGSSTELRKRFKCGYLLRVQREDGKLGPVLDLAKEFSPEARETEEREDTIVMPVDPKIPLFLRELEKKKQELGVSSYSFSVEQLEDMLLKIIQTAEAALS